MVSQKGFVFGRLRASDKSARAASSATFFFQRKSSLAVGIVVKDAIDGHIGLAMLLVIKI